MSFYLKPDEMYEVVAKRWGFFLGFALFNYIYHLLFAIDGVDAYCDVTRTFGCDGARPVDPKNAADPMVITQSAIYDLPLMLCAVWHLIEWVRWTIFLTTILVNKNLLFYFNILQFNVIFGFVATIWAIVTRFSGVGATCAGIGAQYYRGTYLAVQILCLALSIPLGFIHIIIFYIRGRDWVHE